MAKLRLGLIGCGNMEGVHQQGFGELAAQMQVTATADLALERAQVAAAAVGADLAVADFHDLLDHVDAVLIAAPHHQHHPVGLACLRAGKHVLVEKPMATSEADCLELIHAAQTQQRVLMTAYCMRFHPLVERVKQLLDERAYGDVFQVSIWTEQHTERPPGHWSRSAKILGGGQFFSHGCHYVDLLLWFLGRPLRGTHLGTNYGTPWMEREGTSNATIEFADGPLGYHFGTWGARGSRLRYNIQAHCTGGMIEADITGGKLYAHTKQGTALLYEGEPQAKYTQYELAHFLACVADGQQPLTDGPGSLQGLRVIWRLYAAEQAGVVADLRGLGLDESWDQPGLGELPTAASQPA
jgi:predicted dehydrogenase